MAQGTQVGCRLKMTTEAVPDRGARAQYDIYNCLVKTYEKKKYL